MADIKKLLEVRKVLKKKSPIFIRQDYQRRKRLKTKLNWKRPKGLHSKMRLHKKGHRKLVSTGYKAPLAVRGMHSSGLIAVVVHNARDVGLLNPESQGAVVSSGVGRRKAITIIDAAIERKIRLLNIKDPAAFKEEVRAGLEKRKKERASRMSEEKSAASKPAEKGKQAKSKPKLEEKLEGEKELTDEEKKKAEKAEKDKILIKRTG